MREREGEREGGGEERVILFNYRCIYEYLLFNAVIIIRCVFGVFLAFLLPCQVKILLFILFPAV